MECSGAGGCKGRDMQNFRKLWSSWQPNITSLWEEGTQYSSCPMALFSCLPILQTDYAAPPPSEPLLGHWVFLLSGSPS